MNQVPEKLLLHVGFQKAGSTWIQRSVFDRGQCGFLPWGLAGSEQEACHLWQADRFEYSVDALREAYLKELRPVVPRDAWVAISNERFSGNVISGGYDSEWNAHVLSRMFPSARVLIVVREQRSMLRSAYAHFVDKGGTMPCLPYLTQSTRKLPTFDLRFFEYHKLVSAYRQLFGQERVLVLPFEFIVASPTEFVRRLRQFCDLPATMQDVPAIPMHKSASPLSVALMRRLNPLRRSHMLNGNSRLATSVGKRIVNGLCGALNAPVFDGLSNQIKRRWEADIARIAAERYRRSNQLLVEMTGLPLRQLGYDLGPESAVGTDAVIRMESVPLLRK